MNAGDWVAVLPHSDLYMRGVRFVTVCGIKGERITVRRMGDTRTFKVTRHELQPIQDMAVVQVTE